MLGIVCGGGGGARGGEGSALGAGPREWPLRPWALAREGRDTVSVATRPPRVPHKRITPLQLLRGVGARAPPCRVGVRRCGRRGHWAAPRLRPTWSSPWYAQLGCPRPTCATVSPYARLVFWHLPHVSPLPLTPTPYPAFPPLPLPASPAPVWPGPVCVRCTGRGAEWRGLLLLPECSGGAPRAGRRRGPLHRLRPEWRWGVKGCPAAPLPPFPCAFPPLRSLNPPPGRSGVGCHRRRLLFLSSPHHFSTCMVRCASRPRTCPCCCADVWMLFNDHRVSVVTAADVKQCQGACRCLRPLPLIPRFRGRVWCGPSGHPVGSCCRQPLARRGCRVWLPSCPCWRRLPAVLRASMRTEGLFLFDFHLGLWL